MAISTNGTVLTRLAGALYNTQMSNATYEEVKTLDPSSLADALYARDFSSATDATVATTLVTNLGLTSVTGLANWVAAQLTAAGSHKGAKVVELLNGFAQMSADATYGAAATAFNTKVNASLIKSQTVGNAGGSFATADSVAPINGATFALTAGLDTTTGTVAADTFVGTYTSGASTDTISLGDTLTGNGGVDTFKAYVGAGATAGITLPAVSLSGVSNFVLNSSSGQTLTVDAVNSLAGVTNITTTSTAAAVTFDRLSKAATVTQQGQSYGTLTLGFNGLATTDTVNLVVNGAYGTSATGQATIALGTGTGAATTDKAPNIVSLSGTGGLVTLSDASLTTVSAAFSGSSTLRVTGTTAPALKSIDLSGSTGSFTTDLASYATPATLATAATGFTFKGSAGNDTVRLGLAAGATATSSALDNYSSSTYSMDAGAGTNTLTLYATPATAGVAPATVLSSSGFALAGTTADATALSAVNAFKNLTTLRINQYDTTATAATGNVSQGAVTLAVNTVSSVSDFAVSSGFLTSNTGGYVSIINPSASTTGTGGNALTISGQTSQTLSMYGQFKGGTGLASTTATAGSAGGDALSIAPVNDTGTNAITITLSDATITGGTGGANSAATGSTVGGAGGDAIDTSVSGATYEILNIISSGTTANTATNNVNSLVGGTGGAVTSATGTAGASGNGLNIATNGLVNVSGSKNISLGNVSGTTYTIDASALTGNLTLVQVDTSNDTFKGGSGTNNLTIAGGITSIDITKSTTTADVINADALTVSTANSASNPQLTITGFNLGTGVTVGDNLNMKSTAVIAATGNAQYTGTTSAAVVSASIGATGVASVSVVSGTPTLTDYVNVVMKAAETVAAGGTVQYQVAAFEYGGNTYLTQELATTSSTTAGGFTAGTDLVVKLVGLTGVTGLSTTASGPSTIWIG